MWMWQRKKFKVLRKWLKIGNPEYRIYRKPCSFQYTNASSDPHKIIIESIWETSNTYRMPYRTHSYYSQSVSFKNKNRKRVSHNFTCLMQTFIGS